MLPKVGPSAVQELQGVVGFPEYFATADKYALPLPAAQSGTGADAGGSVPTLGPTESAQQPEGPATGRTLASAADVGATTFEPPLSSG